MFTLEWQATIKLTILQDKDLQVAQINQFYITGEEIFKLYKLETNSTKERSSRTKHFFILGWTKISVKMLIEY